MSKAMFLPTVTNDSFFVVLGSNKEISIFVGSIVFFISFVIYFIYKKK